MTEEKKAKSRSRIIHYRGLDESLYGPVHFICVYLLVILISFVVFAALQFYYSGPNNDQLLNLLVYIACAGGIGGTVFCMRGLIKHLIRGDFRSTYFFWYLFRPFISAVIGVFSFFVVYGGLLIVMSGTIPNQVEITSRNVKAFYCAIAFISGFSVDEFVGKLRDLAKTMFTKIERDWTETK